MSQISYGTITITDTNDIESIVVEYNRNQSTSSPPADNDSGWSTNRPAWAQGYYIWQRTRIHKSGTATSSDTFGTPVCITGSTGQTGATGTSITISSTSVKYQVSSSGTTTPTGTWQNNVQATTTGQFLWTRTIVTYSDGSSTTSYSVAAHGSTGAAGSNGTSVSISSIKYAVSTTDSQPADSSFTYTSVPTVAEGSWLWTLTTYSNGSKMYTKSKQGKSGTNGTNGTDGRSLTNTVTHFTVAASNVTITQSNMGNYTWTTNTSTYNSLTPAYWVRVTNTYSNPSSTEYIFYKDQGLSDANAVAATANSNASAAVATASSAVTIANDAAAAASNASILAGSKNAIYYTTAPASPSGSFKNGDVWVQTQTSSSTQDGIAGSRLMYLYEDNNWNQVKFGTGSLVAGTVVADLIAGNAITAGQIAANTITADRLDMGSINASQSITVGAFSTSLTNSLASNEQLIYIQATSAVSPPSAFPPSATSSSSYWVTNSGESVVGSALPTWTLKHPTYSSAYPVTYIAKQKISVDGIISCTTPLRDDSTTVIDGGNITTGSIDASLITTNKIQGSQIAADTIDVQNLNLYGELTFHKSKTTADIGGALGYTDGIDWFQPQDIVRQMNFELGAIDNTDGTEVTNTKAIRTSGYFSISGNTRCTLYCDSIAFNSTFSSIVIVEYSGNSSSSFIQYSSFENNNDSITLDPDTNYVRVVVIVGNRFNTASSFRSAIYNYINIITGGENQSSVGMGLFNNTNKINADIGESIPSLRVVMAEDEEVGLYEFLNKDDNDKWINTYGAYLKDGQFRISNKTNFSLPPGNFYGQLEVNNVSLPWFADELWVNTTLTAPTMSDTPSGKRATLLSNFDNLYLYNYLIFEIAYTASGSYNNYSYNKYRASTIVHYEPGTIAQPAFIWYSGSTNGIVATYRIFYINKNSITCGPGQWTNNTSHSTESNNDAIPIRIMGIMGATKEKFV